MRSSVRIEGHGAAAEDGRAGGRSRLESTPSPSFPRRARQACDAVNNCAETALPPFDCRLSLSKMLMEVGKAADALELLQVRAALSHASGRVDASHAALYLFALLRIFAQSALL